jgi:hypothetical protein
MENQNDVVHEDVEFFEYKDNDIVLFKLESRKYYDENKISYISIRAVLEIWKVHHLTCDYLILCSDTATLHENHQYSIERIQVKIIWILRDIAKKCIQRAQKSMIDSSPLERWSLILDVVGGPSYDGIYLPIQPVLDVMIWLRDLEVERLEDMENYYRQWWNLFYRY